MTKPKLYYHAGSELAPKPYHYKECGLANVYLANGYDIEEHDGEEFVSVHNVDGLWKAIGMNLVTSQKVLSPREIRFLRTQLGRTQAEIAGILRVDDQTVARWEKGLSKLPGPADLSLRVLYLSSDAAKPEGLAMLEELVQLVQKLVERDAPVRETVTFSQHDTKWEPELIAC